MILVEPMPDLGEVNVSHQPGRVAFLIESLSADEAWALGNKLLTAASAAAKKSLTDSNEAAHRR